MRVNQKMKATKAIEAKTLEQIPNVGKVVRAKLEKLGITKPEQLKGKDGLELYRKLNKLTESRHDPCLADTFMAVVDFMNGGMAKPWWDFTSKRKELMPK